MDYEENVYAEPDSSKPQTKDRSVQSASTSLKPDKKYWKMKLSYCFSLMLAVTSLMMIVILCLTISVMTEIQSKNNNQKNINDELNQSVNRLAKNNIVLTQYLAEIQDTGRSSPTAATSRSSPTTATSSSYPTAATGRSYYTAATSKNYPTATTSKSYPTAATSKSYPTAATSKSYPTAATSKSYPTAATSKSYPNGTAVATSCHNILLNYPSSPSGFYEIQTTNGSTIRVFCDMTRTCGNITGGWMRVAELDMRRISSQCPLGLCLNNIGIRSCQICSTAGGCSSDVYPVNVQYTRVCGRVIGYQYGSVDAFSLVYSSGFDGVQLAHGNPPKIIWTFAAFITDDFNSIATTSACPCAYPNNTNIQDVPTVFGNYYFCDTGLHDRTNNQLGQLFVDAPLWDGIGCEHSSTCCSLNNPPWFFRELSYSTNEDIQMRICRDEPRSNEDIVIDRVDIFVQ